MAEAIRLVIWDLDDTFWQGTLAEGGYSYNATAHAVVVELARRGIMSSICSKNDPDAVRTILERHEIWNYFIFPSINWEPKGQRIQALIEAVQLRPETVMVIDDNPMNLHEATFYSPNVQTAPETIIPEILDSPLFKGKDDRALTRLAQYKILEKRKADEALAVAQAGDNFSFLRASGVRVEIDYDVERNLDRAIELINRTNQLNFTKNRLPEESEEARAELRRALNSHLVQAALIRVTDDYGDYGYCGFYALQGQNAANRRLIHFCFSCRILNMGVETWVYRQIGRPKLDVVGEVLTDVMDESFPVDWIAASQRDWAVASQHTAGARTPAAALRVERMVAHGGCDLMAITHYFSMLGTQVLGEFNTVRDGVPIRVDHSLLLKLAMERRRPEVLAALARIGYVPDDLTTGLFDNVGTSLVWLLSFWGDAVLPVYRHKRLRFRIPFPMDVRQQRSTALDNQRLAASIESLRAEYDYEFMVRETAFKETITKLLQRAPVHAQIFILGSNEHWRDPSTGREVYGHRRQVPINRWTREVIAAFPNAHFLDVRAFIADESEVEMAQQFQRVVYFRIYQHILSLAGVPRTVALEPYPDLVGPADTTMPSSVAP